MKLRGCILLAAVAAGLSVAAMVGRAPQAFAEGGEYPYATMPCVWAPFATAGTGAQWCNDYDWGEIPGSTAAASVISPYGYYYRNCTDYAAWKVSTLGVAPAQYAGLGNAKDWAARAPAHGLRVDATPAVGSVAVRVSGTYGHTAFVEAVNPPGFPEGTIQVSHYNYYADGNYTEKYGSPASFGFVAFVHFEDYEQPAEPEPEPAPAPVVTAPPEAAPPVEAAAPSSPPAQMQAAPVEVAPTPPVETAKPASTKQVRVPPLVSSDPVPETSKPEVSAPAAKVMPPVAVVVPVVAMPEVSTPRSSAATGIPPPAEPPAVATSPLPAVAAELPPPAPSQPAPALESVPADSPKTPAALAGQPSALPVMPAARQSPPSEIRFTVFVLSGLLAVMLLARRRRITV